MIQYNFSLLHNYKVHTKYKITNKGTESIIRCHFKATAWIIRATVFSVVGFCNFMSCKFGPSFSCPSSSVNLFSGQWSAPFVGPWLRVRRSIRNMFKSASSENLSNYSSDLRRSATSSSTVHTLTVTVYQTTLVSVAVRPWMGPSCRWNCQTIVGNPLDH